MGLREEMEHSGQYLFRWRSYTPVIPLLILVGAAAGAKTSAWTPGADRAWDVFCLLLSFAGLAVRAHVVGTTPYGTSGRNTRAQVAAVLNVSGWYSMVRHPLLGNLLLWLGVALLPRVWWAAVLCALFFWVYYERIMFAEEEEFLRRKFGERFVVWSERTPAMVPVLTRWRGPDRPFALRTVLRREYSGMFGAAVAFAAIDVVRDHASQGIWTMDPLWKMTFSASAVT